MANQRIRISYLFEDILNAQLPHKLILTLGDYPESFLEREFLEVPIVDATAQYKT